MVSVPLRQKVTVPTVPIPQHCLVSDSHALKVPKCEIFDLSDFPDFYTIKSSWVGDLVVKINKKFYQHFRVHLGVQSSLRICSVYF